MQSPSFQICIKPNKRVDFKPTVMLLPPPDFRQTAKTKTHTVDLTALVQSRFRSCWKNIDFSPAEESHEDATRKTVDETLPELCAAGGTAQEPLLQSSFPGHASKD